MGRMICYSMLEIVLVSIADACATESGRVEQQTRGA